MNNLTHESMIVIMNTQMGKGSSAGCVGMRLTNNQTLKTFVNIKSHGNPIALH